MITPLRECFSFLSVSGNEVLLLSGESLDRQEGREGTGGGVGGGEEGDSERKE